MSAPLFARGILTAIAAGQGVAPLFIDLNRTHANNPLWPGHARFHVVSQTFAEAMAGAVEVALIWWPGSAVRERFYLAAFLAAIPMAAFFLAMLARRLYSGTLHDPNGIPPVRLRTGTRVVEFDLNVVIVTFASALLVVAVFLF